jgi:hypothetical protein
MMVRALVAAALLALAACATVPGDSSFEAGRMAFTRGDLQVAYADFREAADKGDVRAQKTLGTMLDHGVEIQGGQKLEARPEEAARWYRKAADSGDAQAANQLAVMYTYGRGVPVDYAEAMRLIGFPKDGREYYGIPPEHRDELYLWTQAVKTEIYRQMSSLTHRYRHGVTVKAIFAGKAPHVTLKTEDAGPAVDAVRAVAERAVALAPPTPAAVRENFKFSYDIDFM